jgi:hypothetical protein
MNFTENKEYEEFYRKNWKQYASESHFWFQKAQALYDAANVVRYAFWPEKRTPRDRKAAVSDFYKGTVYMLLAGLAVETILKGILIGQNPQLVEKQELWKELVNHDLKKLYKKTKLTMSNLQNNLFERLTNYVITFGKYPVTKIEQNMSKRGETSFSSQTDFDGVDQLWDFLSKKIQTFIKKVK